MSRKGSSSHATVLNPESPTEVVPHEVEKMEWEVGACWMRHIAQLVNKNFEFTHGGSPHFDFAEAEGVGHSLSFAGQYWMYPAIPSRE